MRVDHRYWVVEGDVAPDWHQPFVQFKCLPFIKTLAVAAVMERDYFEGQKLVLAEIMRLATVTSLGATFITNREEIFQAWSWAHAHGMTRPEFHHIPAPFEWSSPLMMACKPRMENPVMLYMGNSYDVRAFFANVHHPADLVAPPSASLHPDALTPAPREPLVDLDGDVADTGPTERAAYDALKAHLLEIDKLFGISPGESRLDKLREIKRLAAIGRQFQDNLEDIENLREEIQDRVDPDEPFDHELGPYKVLVDETLGATVTEHSKGPYTHTFRPGTGKMTFTTEHADGTEAAWDASGVVESIDVTTFHDAAAGYRAFVDPKTGKTTKRLIDPID